MKLRPCAHCQQKLPRDKFWGREWARPYGHTLACKDCCEKRVKKRKKLLTDAT